LKSPFENSSDNKRYLNYNYFLRNKFGSKVFKVSLNASMTCPNRDGTKGFGGCSFCSESGSGDFAGCPTDDIATQFDTIRKKMHKKWHEARYIPYFQAGSNTYADVNFLKEIYEKAISFPNVVGLSIATRPDCINEEIADLLKNISEKTYLTVELGLQTIHDKTAELTNRCHSYADFFKGYELLNSRGINICVHIINGLPHETHEMMLETIREVARLKPHSVKIHLLHIIKGTRLCDEFLQGGFSEMSLEGYVKIVCDQLELLPPEVIIQRVTGDGDKTTLVAPLWSLKKFCVMNEIDKELVARNSMQGSKYLK